MDPVRRRSLQHLGSVVHFKRLIVGGASYQRRGLHQSNSSRSIPLENKEASPDNVRALRGEDTENGPADSLKKTTRDYQKLIASKSPKRREKKHFLPVKRTGNESTVKTTEATDIKIKASIKPSTEVEYIKIGTFQPFHPAFLRDACECEKCVDPSSKQKNFQTTDIPQDIKAGSVNVSPEGIVEIVWGNDIPGFESGHKSVYPKAFFGINSHPTPQSRARFLFNDRTLWDKERITKELEYVNYEDYMNTDEALFRAVRSLHSHGLLLVRGVPESEKSVEEIANRIGNLRDTFYGRTWDVKSVAQAKNVAYTAQFLGLHMDLLYMSDPPGFQFLHCLKNTCEGGSSLFTDAMYAASKLDAKSFYRLATMQLAYHYKNAGEHYYFRHPVIQIGGSFFTEKRNKFSHNAKNLMQFINYSPPFQANHVACNQQQTFPNLLKAMREFSSLVESEENLYEYRLQEGECVIFNNRRVLHGRRQFDTSAGSRWLKGAYIDTDVFMSKYRVLSEKYADLSQADLDEGRRLVNDSDGGSESLE